MLFSVLDGCSNAKCNSIMPVFFTNSTTNQTYYMNSPAPEGANFTAPQGESYKLFIVK